MPVFEAELYSELKRARAMEWRALPLTLRILDFLLCNSSVDSDHFPLLLLRDFR